MCGHLLVRCVFTFLALGWSPFKVRLFSSRNIEVAGVEVEGGVFPFLFLVFLLVYVW